LHGDFLYCFCLLAESYETTNKSISQVFTSDGRQNKEIDPRISNANPVLRELYRSVVTKPDLSNTTKLSVFKSVFVRNLRTSPMVMNLG